MMQRRLWLSGLVATLLVGTGSAHAVPALQLSIDPSIYDSTTETVVATNNPFNLYAWATPTGNMSAADALGQTFYVSMALIPQLTGTLLTQCKANPNLAQCQFGSFSYSVNGGPTTSVDVLADMLFGTPPADSVFTDLPSHGVFDTFYVEVPLQFVATRFVTGAPPNTQTDPDATPSAYTDPTKTAPTSYWAGVTINVANLTNKNIHFDLYNEAVKKCAKGATDCVDKLLNAPFSHDAESNGGTTPVPEPATLALLGVGLVGVGTMLRRRRV